jgi:hypothetical protein
MYLIVKKTSSSAICGWCTDEHILSLDRFQQEFLATLREERAGQSVLRTCVAQGENRKATFPSSGEIPYTSAMRTILPLLLLTFCCLMSAGCKDRHTAAVDKLALEQKTLDNLDIRLRELDKVIAEREQEAATAEFESGHGTNLTPEQIKLADDQLARLKSQHEQIRKADQAQRLGLYKKKMAQEVAVTKAEREVKVAHW